MNNSDVEQRLLLEEARIRSLIAQLERGGVVVHSGDDEHLDALEDRTLDGGTELTERSLQLGLLENLEEELQAIERARAHLIEGTYGTCLACDQPIAAERLEVIPVAEFCTRHAG